MATITNTGELIVTAKFEVTEGELRALDALAGYGDDAFIAAFYEKLGKSYMYKHEADLRKFLQSIRDEAGRILARADAARKAFRSEP